MQAPVIEMPSERVILLRFGDRIDLSCNALVHAAAATLAADPVAGLEELIPAYASLAIHYEPAAWTNGSTALTPAQKFADAVLQRMDSLNSDRVAEDRTEHVIEIPVCYDIELGPDLIEAAAELNLSIEELVTRHVSADYRVAMLGFAPGFPYLLGLDPKLQMPRRRQPRLRVPAGSVAIGGAQTGIYPAELPGGWRLIGRTPLRLFDLARKPPQTLNPGDLMRFIAIDRERFDALVGEQR